LITRVEFMPMIVSLLPCADSVKSIGAASDSA